MRIDGAQIPEKLIIPNVFQQLLARKNLIGRAGQVMQQLVLFRRQIYFLAACGHAVSIMFNHKMREHDVVAGYPL